MSEWEELAGPTNVTDVYPPLVDGDQFRSAHSGGVYEVVSVTYNRCRRARPGSAFTQYRSKVCTAILRLSAVGLNDVSQRGWRQLEAPRVLRSLTTDPGTVFETVAGRKGCLLRYDRYSDRPYVIKYDDRDSPSRVAGEIKIVAFGTGTRDPGVAPRVTEIVCSGCGRPLGEFSDGTMPRSVLAPCCSRPTPVDGDG